MSKTQVPGTIAEARQAIVSGALSPAQLVEQAVAAISRWEPHLHAFLEVFGEQAAAAAQHVSTTDSPLAGIPVAIKDIISTTEGHTTAASRILQQYCAPFDATVVSKLRAAGAIIIGKTNCDEFAMGSSNEYSAYGPVKNPWDTCRVPGGSSGGSAAAVSSGEVLAALGTDTGGSVRLPASFCGIVGLKPTYSRISRFGVVAYASSFDQVGPFARTVADVAALLEVLAGRDVRDATSSPRPVKAYTAACGQPVQGVTVGVPREFLGDEVTAPVREAVRAALQVLADGGARLKEISLPLMHAAIPTYYLLVKSEAASNLSRYDALRYSPLAVQAGTLVQQYQAARAAGFGPEVKRSILMGTYALSAGYIDAWYKQASRVRTLIRREFEQAFQQVEVIAGPVAADVAFPLGEKTADPLAMYLADLLTDPASVAGLPALSMPCGFASKAGACRTGTSDQVQLPIGLQLIAPHFEEERLFTVGHAYEQATDWHKIKPKLPGR